MAHQRHPCLLPLQPIYRYTAAPTPVAVCSSCSVTRSTTSSPQTRARMCQAGRQVQRFDNTLFAQAQEHGFHVWVSRFLSCLSLHPSAELYQGEDFLLRTFCRQPSCLPFATDAASPILSSPVFIMHSVQYASSNPPQLRYHDHPPGFRSLLLPGIAHEP